MRFSVPNFVLFAAMAAASALPVTEVETAVSVPGELVPATGLSVLAPAVRETLQDCIPTCITLSQWSLTT
jgi:hypothetical protein